MTGDKIVFVMGIYIYIIVTWRDGGQNSEITSNESESVPFRLSRRYPLSDEILVAVNISLKENCGLS
jgi:hypothetical protein